MRARKLGILILLTMLLLAAVVGLQGGLDFDITFRFDPVWIAAGILFGMFAIFLSARHPAAFIAPMLFAPRVMELPVFSRFAETRNLTALAVTAGILGLAIFMRFLWLCKQPGAIWDLFRGGKRAIIAYLLFAAVIALSYLYTPAPDSGGDKLLDFLVFGSLAFFAPFLLVRTEKDYRDFVIGTVIFSLAAAGYMLGASHQGRLAEHQHPQHIGVGQLVGWAILLLLFHRITDRYLRAAALFVCIPCLAVGLAAAETRGPLLALVLVLGLSMVFSRLKTSLISRRATVYVMLTVALAVFVLSTFWFVGTVQHSFQKKTSEMVQLMQGSTEANGTATKRLAFYKAALHTIPDHPILGWGVSGWSMYYFRTDDRRVFHYPHNLVLEVAVEQGIVGLVALLNLLGTAFIILKRDNDGVAGRFPSLLPALIFLFLVTMFSGDIVEHRYLWFWCGMVFACRRIALFEPNEEEAPLEEWVEGAGHEGPAPVLGEA